ncbi:hypothetical protein HK097_006705 [Rhizophlyctis rosea]|uniref:Uncharacterized protein n=1 Tax=Rhizophlyctis rosea TaxID=64517 RepID=A0AAD5SDY5_9FUNG|nr:hypothetical protein HK097_006705 [Rhizophlyctis rosea]
MATYFGISSQGREWSTDMVPSYPFTATATTPFFLFKDANFEAPIAITFASVSKAIQPGATDVLRWAKDNLIVLNQFGGVTVFNDDGRKTKIRNTDEVSLGEQAMEGKRLWSDFANGWSSAVGQIELSDVESCVITPQGVLTGVAARRFACMGPRTSNFKYERVNVWEGKALAQTCGRGSLKVSWCVLHDVKIVVQIALFQHIMKMTNLTALDLTTHDNPASLVDLFNCATFGRLRDLDLSGATLNAEAIRSVGRGCPVLRLITIHNKEMSRACLLALSTISSLREVDMRYSRFDVAVEEFLTYPHLHTVRLSLRKAASNISTFQTLFLALRTHTHIITHDVSGVNNDQGFSEEERGKRQTMRARIQDWILAKCADLDARLQSAEDNYHHYMTGPLPSVSESKLVETVAKREKQLNEMRHAARNYHDTNSPFPFRLGDPCCGIAVLI